MRRESYCLLLLYAAYLVYALGQDAKVDVDLAFFQNRKVRCTSDESPNGNLFFLSTPEGLASHYYQLKSLWVIVKSWPINRGIIDTPFASAHYGDKLVSVCDIFVLPPEIQCSCSSMKHIGSLQTFCPILFTRKGRSANEKEYGLLSNTSRTTTDIDLEKEGCLAGSMGAIGGTKYANISRSNPMNFSMPVQFQPEFLYLAETVKRLLNISTKPYVTAHWRRGDQLTTRCTATNHQHDGSVNCQSVGRFIHAVHAKHIHQQRVAGHSSAVYIATNEQNVTQLEALHRMGYLTAANITAVLQPYTELAMIELFVLELILMCQSEAAWLWGLSTVQSLVHDCHAHQHKNTQSDAGSRVLYI
jgi:hypothetical protein